MWPWATWIGKQGSEIIESSPRATVWLVVGSERRTRTSSARNAASQKGAQS